MEKLKPVMDKKSKKVAEPVLEPEVVEEAPKKSIAPAKGKKVVKVLGKKKTIRDAEGEWEVTDARVSYMKEKNINSSDSENMSELSMD